MNFKFRLRNRKEQLQFEIEELIGLLKDEGNDLLLKKAIKIFKNYVEYINDSKK